MTLCCYIRWCTLCQHGYYSDTEWLNHLLLKSHCDLAITSCQQWTAEDFQCCVVVFMESVSGSGFTLNRCYNKVLQHFRNLQKGIQRVVVNDLLRSDQQKNVLVLRFESRSKVDEIFAAVKKPQVKIEGIACEIRRMADYMPIERKSLFPWIFADTLTFERVQTSTDEDKEVPVVVPKRKKTAPAPDKPPLEQDKDQSVDQLKLIQDFKDIRATLEIPQQEFVQVLNLMQRLQTFLEIHMEGCKLFLFRHWYLRLRNLGTNELLIYIRHDKLLMTTPTTEYYQEIFDKYPNLAFETCDDNTRHKEPHGKTYVDKDTGIRFSLVDFGFLYTEMQTCQLVNHYTTLDPRVKGLLTVVLYWAKVNRICLQRQLVTSKDTASLAPEPAAWEWLVMFYLMKEKVIPKVANVIPEMLIDNNMFERLVRPGFRMKPDWEENHHLKEEESQTWVKELVGLTQGFFKFYGDQLQNEKQCLAYILNLRDGSIITAQRTEDTGNCFHFKKLPEFGSRLTDKLKGFLRTDALLKGFSLEIRLQAGSGVKMPIYLLHPLYFRNGFVLNATTLQDTWEKMKITGERLEAVVGRGEDVWWKEALCLESAESQPRKRQRTD